MKNSLKLIALVFIFSFSSCGTEELTETNTETQSSIAKSLTEIEDIRLHNLMEWTGYLASQVGLNSNLGRTQLLNAYNAGSGSVSLSDLLEVSDQSFKKALKIEFYRYILTPSCVSDGRPKDHPTPPELPGHPNYQHGSWIFEYGDPNATEEEINEERFEQYLGLILEENCLEIYFPNGFSMPIRNIKSSAHPLVDQNFNNEAYKHVAECNISETNVTSGTVGNIIIVRPSRSFRDTNCTYTQFDFDFTDFLN
ncbi:hypothetical protein [uncultured Kordia sp.]|uniref:hypothetical protein n=1 Tax=uncultured Kordia sp. TaxID=507699 RepID=UPI002622F9D3|nr:hypothetical protein [uncultured Kordia sp.]